MHSNTNLAQLVFDRGSQFSLVFAQIFSIFFAFNPFGYATQASETQSLAMPTVNARITMIYSDRAAIPGADKTAFNSDNNYSDSDSKDLRPTAMIGDRAFGVSEALVRLHWNTSSGTFLAMTLRPDALSVPTTVTESGEAVRREIDRRIGDVYRPAASVKLLDAYAVGLRPGGLQSSLEMSVGVFDGVAARRAAYSEVLEFGLNVVFPRKFSGAKMDWFSSPNTGESAERWHFQVTALHGDDDRADNVQKSSRTLDEGSAAKDPYSGGALWFGKNSKGGTALSYGVLFGFGDHRQQFSKADSPSVSEEYFTKRSETYTAFQVNSGFGSVSEEFGTHRFQLALDLRLAKDSFTDLKVDGIQTKVTPLEQKSIGLTSSTELAKKTRLLGGIHLGTAELHDSETSAEKVSVQGYQADLGVLYGVDRNLDISLLGAMEHRSRKSSKNSDSSGGFVADQSRKEMKRIGLSLRFAI